MSLTSSPATLYDLGVGACGVPCQASDSVVALSNAHRKSGAHCFQHLEVGFDGFHVDVTVVDLCPGCGTDDIQLSRGAYAQLEDEDDGRIQDLWSFK
ncbi:RlpA-like double-psi beta-barrel-protein domain-containing protein-containing protein [Mycena epipterygia]|nr:RlpA-like double-psi beta-barrel-protein domain-containing protein-containing protein [Mycena epipterygia]